MSNQRSLYLDRAGHPFHNSPMTRVWRLLALLSLAALVGGLALTAGEKERLLFRNKPADSYPARDAHDELVVAAEPFETPEEVREAFGKNDPSRAGILPLLLVITNTGKSTVRLEDMKAVFITFDRQKLEPVPANDVAIRLRKKVDVSQKPKSRIPGLPNIGGRGGDSGIEVLANAFEMRMIVPQSTASGFLYFDVGSTRNWLSGAKLFLTGMRWANNGKELMYFEVNLDKARPQPPASK